MTPPDSPVHDAAPASPGGAEVTSFAALAELLRAEFGARVEEQPHDRGRGALCLQGGPGKVALVEPGAKLPPGAHLVVVAGAPARLAEALRALGSCRVQLLPLPCPRAVALRAVTDARAAADAFARESMAERLLDIGLALNAERDPGRVLDLILQHARSITGADAGSIYLVEEGGRALRFKVAQNDSVDADFSEFTVPVTESSVVGTCVITGQVVNIPDLYVAPVALGRRFHHDRSFDARFGYQTRSMITTPMRPPGGEVLGVIQLINAKEGAEPLRGEDFTGRVHSFTAADERLCTALAAQGAVALENARLYDEIQRLFEGFVRASVHAIEQRDPTTSGHSQRVADLTVALARTVDGVTSGPLAALRFSREDLREIEYAGLLHDFGKVGVREQVLVKAKKLYPHQLDRIMERFDHMRTVLRLELLEQRVERAQRGRSDDDDLVAEHDRRLEEIEAMVQAVLEANEPTVLDGEEATRLHEIARVEFRNSQHRRIRLLEDEEVRALLVRRGSLTDAERAEIQSHVTHTYNFLVRIPWGKSLARVPDIASKHHEYLDGSGYPSQIGEPHISPQTRMMTISDIFDALTAADRPYKRAVPVERALDILAMEVEAGKVDRTLLEVFIEAKVFQCVGVGLP